MTAEELLIKYSELCFKIAEDLLTEDDWLEQIDDLDKEHCNVVGHLELVADQCNKPEHDFCPRCHKQRMSIKQI